MEAKDEFTISWCEKHKQHWVQNCPDCMAEDCLEEGRKAGINLVWKELQNLGYQRVLDDIVLRSKLKEWSIK